MDIHPHHQDPHATSGRDGPLVVGIGADGRAASAVVWAAEEANRTGRRLVLVSALNDQPPSVFRDHDLASLARRLTLADVQHVVHEGRAPRVILDSASADPAALIVVGRRGMSLLRRNVVGGTSLIVVSAAPCPIVVVPEEWIQPSMCSRPIVLGLRPEDPGDEVRTGPDDPQQGVIKFAFERADSMRVPLTVISAWSIPPSLMRNATEIAQCRDRFADRLGLRLAAWRELFPAVEVARESEAEQPLAALLEAESGAQLLVVGRHSGTTPPPSGLGSTTRALIRRAHRPVAVIPVTGP